MLADKTPLDVFSCIAESDYSPWKRSYIPMERFKQLLNATPLASLRHNVPFVPVFPDPLNDIQRYYVRMIQNAFYTYLNELLTQVKGATIDVQKSYLITNALDGEINQQLLDAAESIRSHDLALATSFPDLDRLRAPTGNNTDAYIINVLKFHLLAIMLNVQNLYPRYAVNAITNPSDLHLKYFYQSLADGLFEAPQMKIEENILATAVEKFSEFTPIMDDIKGRKKARIPFGEFIESEVLLTRMEVYLHGLGYLTDNYLLTDEVKKNVKREFCALILEIERLEGFKKVAYVKNKKVNVTKAHLLEFFNNRYQEDFKDILNGMRRKEAAYDSFYEERSGIISKVLTGDLR